MKPGRIAAWAIAAAALLGVAAHIAKPTARASPRCTAAARPLGSVCVPRHAGTRRTDTSHRPTSRQIGSDAWATSMPGTHSNRMAASPEAAWSGRA